MPSSKINGNNIDPFYKMKQIKITLPSTGWSSSAPYTQSIAVPGITESNIVQCSPEPIQSNIMAVSDSMTIATAQAVNSLIFTAFESKPTIDLKFNLLVGGE